MHIPATYRIADRTVMVSFMKRYSFVTLVSLDRGVYMDKYLPFGLDTDGPQLFLSAGPPGPHEFTMANTAGPIGAGGFHRASRSTSSAEAYRTRIA